MKLYMAVTSDKYELPVAVAGSVQELGRMLGIKADTVRSNISRKSYKGNISGVKYIKIEVED